MNPEPVTDGPLGWQRMSRSDAALPKVHGVYALFLRTGSALPGVRTDASGLIYIGKAEGKTGLKGRCHFDARTANHSPRKSLAVLLMDRLRLIPVLVTKPNSAATWSLDAASEGRLARWMHANLDIAWQVCARPDERETTLVAHHAPPLNLSKCVQNDGHKAISALRSQVLTALKGTLGR